MNKVILIGNLTKDPESHPTSAGISKCTFSLAVNRRFANSQGVRETDFIPIVCWRQTAELCLRYLSKGRKVAVEGSIQTRTYDAQDGSKRYVTEVVADNVEFVSTRNDGSRQGDYDGQGNYGGQGGYNNAQGGYNNAQGGYGGAPAANQAGSAPRQQAPVGNDSVEYDDDELPF